MGASIRMYNPRRKWLRPLVSCTLAALHWSAVVQAAPGTGHRAVVITDVTVVDVEHGRNVGPRTVLVEDDRIVAIAAPDAVHAPEGAQRVDGRGRFLIPGLTDMHVHLFNLSSHRPPNTWSFPLYVANGITGVRDMRADAASMPLVKQWRSAVESGQLVAPRVLAAGIAVYGTSPADASADVDAATDAGADFIKVFSEVPPTHWRAILAQAKVRALPVVGHVPASVALLEDARQGQRTGEHLTQVYEACSSIESNVLQARQPLNGDALMSLASAQEADILAAFDPVLCQRVATALAATGQAQVPTLVLADEDAFAQNARREQDDRWPLLRPDEQLRWQRFVAGYTQEDATLASRRWPVALRIVSILHRAGVPIMAGTDSPMPGVYPGFALQEELQRLVASGFTPMQALRAATLEPARFLHIDDVSGSVAVGKRADLVLLDADPSRDVRHTQRIRAVVLAGRLLTRSDLDALLDDAAKGKHP